MADETRTDRVVSQVTPTEADQIREAARIERLSVSDFLRRIALDRAERIAADRPTPVAVADPQLRAA